MIVFERERGIKTVKLSESTSSGGRARFLPSPAKKKKKQERVETVNEIDQESVLFCLIITQQFTFELFFF